MQLQVFHHELGPHGKAGQQNLLLDANAHTRAHTILDRTLHDIHKVVVRLEDSRVRCNPGPFVCCSSNDIASGCRPRRKLVVCCKQVRLSPAAEV